MDTHKNARLTPKGREDMVRAVVHGGLTKAAAARRFNTTPKTAAKGVDRFKRRRRGWFARSILKTPFIARPNPAAALTPVNFSKFPGVGIACRLSPPSIAGLHQSRSWPCCRGSCRNLLAHKIGFCQGPLFVHGHVRNHSQNIAVGSTRNGSTENTACNDSAWRRSVG
jgi:hypothetical protein